MNSLFLLLYVLVIKCPFSSSLHLAILSWVFLYFCFKSFHDCLLQHFIIFALKHLSNNLNISVISVLASVGCFFRCELRFSLFFICCLILNYTVFKYYGEFWYFISGKFRLQTNPVGLSVYGSKVVSWVFKAYLVVCST